MQDIEYYKNLDIRRDKHVEPAFIKELRKRHVAAQSSVLDVCTRHDH